MNPPPSDFQSIDQAIAQWRQGDCFLSTVGFVWQVSKSVAITSEGRDAREQDSEFALKEYPGAVILTQTCDIVRACEKRPYIELAPLVEIDPKRMSSIKKGREPRFLFLPAIEDKNLVADLDLCMTVEKVLLVQELIHRISSSHTDTDLVSIQRTITRKRGRFAFPDDIVVMLRTWQEHIQKRHGKNHAEGKLLELLSEIRLIASPSWNALSLEIQFLLLVSSELSGKVILEIDVAFKEWMKMLEKPDRVRRVFYRIESYDSLTAKEYRESDSLDLDHLSD